MATDLERLVLSMEANIKKYERELARATGIADKSMRQIEKRVEQSESKMSAAMSRVGGAIRGGIAGMVASAALGDITALSDSYTKVQNSLKVTGLEGDKLKETYKELFDLSQKQGVPLESLSELYSKTAMSQKELNASGEDLITFTDAVATALRAGGVGAVQADQALTQLGQALTSGKVQWEEMESVVDSAPTIMKAAAAGIKEADGSVGKLTQLIKDGKVSSEALFRGIKAGLPAVQALADKTDETSSQALTRLKNAMTDLVGTFLESTGATGMATTAIGNVASAIKSVTDAIPGAIDALSSYFKKLSETDYFKNYSNALGAGEGGDIPREAASPFSGPAPDRKPTATEPKPVAKVEPISLDKYKVPGSKDKKGGGGGKSENDYKRETDSIRERTAALRQEATTVGLSQGEVAKSEAAYKLLEAAKKANVAVTPQLLSDIETTSSAIGMATQKLHEAEAAYRSFQTTSSQVGHTLADAFKDAVLEGEKLSDVMNKLLKSIAARGVDGFFDSLFKSGGMGNTFLSSILGGMTGGGDSPTGGVRLFDGGGYTGPGGKYQPAGVVHRGEYVMDAATTRRIGRRNLDAIRSGRGYAAGGFVGAPLAPMSPPAVRSAGRATSGPSITKADTYHITPASGVTPDQLRAVLEAHDRALPARLRDIQRRMG